ncbi:MAG: carboxypeptidase-like regulatory domain-containing protein [Flavobacteriales bacterium]|nr:MAG: carboxypeptidase-like regulatory domain-containing protein [Flavobacteriales bacterium]
MHYLNKFINYIYWVLLFNCILVFAQQSTVITGKILDQNGYEVPYAAVGVLQKNMGTTSTEDGTFYFRVSNNELEDNLTVSSLGFSNFSIKIKDFLKLEKKEIVLEEQTTNLSEVVVNSIDFYVKNALKKLRDNTVSKNHQLNILYRRWSVEDNLCRFYIEHSINAIDRGPSSYLVTFSVDHVRTSADYRFVKNEQKLHALKYMEFNNPLRKSINVKSYKWTKTGDSSYDNEDVIIAKGVIENKETLWLYIGMDSNKIYKLEMEKQPKIGKSLIATYVYKKNNKGKLFLSYHQREWKGAAAPSENVKRAMRSNGQTVPKYIPIAYRHEVYVLDIKEDKKRFSVGEMMHNKDMTKYKTAYDPAYWEKLNIPPNTRFFNKNIGELVDLFGVPLENQFKYSNMR